MRRRCDSLLAENAVRKGANSSEGQASLVGAVEALLSDASAGTILSRYAERSRLILAMHELTANTCAGIPVSISNASKGQFASRNFNHARCDSLTFVAYSAPKAGSA
ncbi:hypothetical protein D3C81_1924510 [compost metagenome]